jgi:hypothetical protein
VGRLQRGCYAITDHPRSLVARAGNKMRQICSAWSILLCGNSKENGKSRSIFYFAFEKENRKWKIDLIFTLCITVFTSDFIVTV